jgi:DNA mismatch endonuclease, patch repair protein
MDARKRSALMSRIRGKDTSPELQLRSELFRRGLRYRVHMRGLPGSPDIVFLRTRVAVFVHGCFWHGCPTHYNKPVARARFWADKLEANRERDARVSAALASAGWAVLTFWEHEIEDDPFRVANTIVAFLNARKAQEESPDRRPLRAAGERRSRSA